MFNAIQHSEKVIGHAPGMFIKSSLLTASGPMAAWRFLRLISLFQVSRVMDGKDGF